MHGKRQSDRQLAERGATLSMPERGSESGYTCARFSVENRPNILGLLTGKETMQKHTF